MAELDKVLFDLVKPMVEDKENVQVNILPSENEKEIVLQVLANNEDIARLIGRKGNMASSLRQVMSVASHMEDKEVSIKFEQNA